MSVPIWFTLTSTELAMPSWMPAGQDLGVGDEEVVAHELDLGAERLA